jgi:hypothetical protein
MAEAAAVAMDRVVRAVAAEERAREAEAAAAAGERLEGWEAVQEEEQMEALAVTLAVGVA